jgi:uncharacterized protein (TIGR00251 family)
MIRVSEDGVVLDVRVITRAGRSGIAGTRSGSLLVRLTAPPVEGAANDELVEVIAKALAVPKRAVSLVSGERSRQKRLRVKGVSEDDVRSKLSRT